MSHSDMRGLICWGSRSFSKFWPGPKQAEIFVRPFSYGPLAYGRWPFYMYCTAQLQKSKNSRWSIHLTFHLIVLGGILIALIGLDPLVEIMNPLFFCYQWKIHSLIHLNKWFHKGREAVKPLNLSGVKTYYLTVIQCWNCMWTILDSELRNHLGKI